MVKDGETFETHSFNCENEYLSHAKYFKRLLSLSESFHGQPDHKYALQLAHQAYN